MSSSWRVTRLRPLHLFIWRRIKSQITSITANKISECFKHRINAFTWYLYSGIIVFSQITLWSPVQFIHVYNGSHGFWCNLTLKTLSSNNSLLAEVALLLPLALQPLEVYILWHKQDPPFSEPPWPLTCVATSLPLFIGVHYIQQVQIRLLNNIHRAGACGSLASTHGACLRKTVTEMLLSRVGLELDLAGHKYIKASLNLDRTRGEKWIRWGI